MAGALIKRGIAIFDELRHSVTDIEFLLDPSVGEARIGSTGPSAAIVPAVIHRLTSRYPRISIDVVDAFFDVLMRALHDRAASIWPSAAQQHRSRMMTWKQRCCSTTGSGSWPGRAANGPIGEK